jgi:hypothetical protein
MRAVDDRGDNDDSTMNDNVLVLFDNNYFVLMVDRRCTIHIIVRYIRL